MWLQLTSESFLPRINLITPLENETSVIISYTETSFISNENLGFSKSKSMQIAWGQDIKLIGSSVFVKPRLPHYQSSSVFFTFRQLHRQSSSVFVKSRQIYCQSSSRFVSYSASLRWFFSSIPDSDIANLRQSSSNLDSQIVSLRQVNKSLKMNLRLYPKKREKQEKNWNKLYL